MNIGTLNIEIAANVARIQADMEAVKKAVGSNMAEVEKYANIAKGALLGLGGALSIKSFADMIEGAISAKARLYDLSLQTGITVEALSGLGKVAKFSNTSLDDIAGASNKLSKAMFTQTEESKGAAQAIKALGLNFEEYKRLGADKQFEAVAKAMGKFEDGTGKSAAAMLLYGKTGATLLPFLRELEERGLAVGKQTTESALQAKKYEDNLISLKTATEQWRRELAEFLLPALVGITNELIDGKKAYGGWAGFLKDTLLGGASVSSKDGGLTDTRDKSSAIRKEMEQLDASASRGAFKDTTSSRGNEAAAVRIRAEMQSTLDNLQQRKAFQEIQQQREALATGAGITDKFDLRKKTLALDGLVGDKADKKARDDYTPLIRSINEKIAADRAEFESVAKLTEGQKMQAKVFADIDGGFVKLTLDQKLYVDGLLQQLIAGDKQNLARKQEKKFLSDLHDQQGVALQDSYKAARAAEDEAKVMHDQVAQYGMTREHLAALTTARLRDAAAQLEIQARFNGTSEFSEAQAKDMKDRAAAMRYQADQRDMLAYKEDRARMDPFGGAERAVKSYLDNIRQAGLGTEAVVTRALGNMEDAFVSLATSGKFSFKDLANSIIADIVRIQVRAAITQASSGGGGLGGILSVIGKVVGGLFGGEGSNPDYGNEGRNYPPPEISGQRAAGGPVNAGRSYLVGERGPEILRMGGRSGTVIPNDRIGGAALNVNIINQAGAEVSTSRDSNGDLQVLIAKAAEQGAQRGYRLGVADLVSGTGPMSAALQQRGVSLGNGAVRRY